jgi:hypothetical protein
MPTLPGVVSTADLLQYPSNRHPPHHGDLLTVLRPPDPRNDVGDP